MIVKLPFAHSSVSADLRGLRVHHLRSEAPRVRRSVSALVGEALDHPLAGPPLHELCAGAGSVTVVVPDHTRKADLPVVLPEILGRLRRASSTAAVRLLVACGTHPRAPAELEGELYGPVPSEVAVVHHDCRDPSLMVEVGRLAGGRPLRLHRLAVECDRLITVGAVRHHYFAGFGGGPKMIFPGLAGYEEIQANHARVLLRAGGDGGLLGPDPACQPGRLEGNPVAEEIAAAADVVTPDLALCLVGDRDGRVGWAGAGPWRDAFAAAVATARAWHEVEPGHWSLLVAGAGGAPSDRTLIQAHKALDAACRFARPGAEILLVADLSGGAGSPEMVPFLDDPRRERILDRLERRWIQYGHTTLRIVDKTSRHRVFLRSSLDPDLARRLGFIPVEDHQMVVEGWREERGGETVAVLAGSPVYPRPGS